MTTLSPIEQIMNEMTAGWGNVFDFEPTFSGIENANKYPKYEILKDKKNENKFKIMIASAGLEKSKFKITTLKNKLCVKYDEDLEINNKEDEPEEEYEVISSTIAKRKFTQYFTAPETYVIKVENAEMKEKPAAS